MSSVRSVSADTDARRQTVLVAAAELALAGGVDGVTVRGIAEHAGTSVAALYRLFPDKEAVLVATLRHQLVELAAWQQVRLRGATTDGRVFETLFDGYVAWCEQRPEYRALWFSGEGGATLQELRWTSTRRLIELCVARLPRPGERRDDLRDRVTVAVIAADRLVDASYRYPARRKVLAAGRASLVRYLDDAGLCTRSA